MVQIFMVDTVGKGTEISGEAARTNDRRTGQRGASYNCFFIAGAVDTVAPAARCVGCGFSIGDCGEASARDGTAQFGSGLDGTL